MEAKELRIGNYVNHSHPIGTTLVGKITDGIDIDNYHAQFEPISLTEEWLEKFGFELLSISIPDCYSNNHLRIKKDDRGFWVSAAYNLVLLKNVHSLQNLYFALTGEELKTKS